jgi:hypothetical protein
MSNPNPFNMNNNGGYSNANFIETSQRSYNDGIVFKSEDSIKNNHENSRSQAIFIDSRDRDLSKYANPNEYVIDFPYHYKDVVSLELIAADIPKAQYNVNNNNNKLFISKDNELNAAALKLKSNYVTATIPVGEYNITDLRATLTTTIQNTFSMTINSNIDTKVNKLTLTNLGGTFNMYLNDLDSDNKMKPVSNSISKILGFTSNTQYISQSSGSLAASSMYNLNGEDYIIMKIENIDRAEGSNNVFRGAFAKLSVSEKSHGSTKQLKVSDFGSKSIEIFNPYLGRLSKLKLSFYNQNGSLYDFRGLEHSLSFEIRTLYKNNSY